MAFSAAASRWRLWPVESGAKPTFSREALQHQASPTPDEGVAPFAVELVHFAPPGHRLLKCFDVDGLCVTLTLSFGVVLLLITKNLELLVWLAIIVFLMYKKKKLLE